MRLLAITMFVLLVASIAQVLTQIATLNLLVGGV